MNRSDLRQKRSISKSSPLSKRPKLDFTLRTRSSTKESNDGKDFKESPGSKNYENKSNRNFPSDSDWDDDFSGDMLEKVCLIADLSQAIVNNEPSTERVEYAKAQLFESNTVNPIVDSPEKVDSNEEVEKLKQQLGKLQEQLKTKEGEVHILRSQLKQNEDAKLAAALQNIKVVEEVQKKFSEKISTTEKELETTKTKLQFKNMEYKTLSERCRQLEYNISKNKLGGTSSSQIDGVKGLTSFSQCTQKTNYKETNDNKIATTDNYKEEVIKFEFPTIDCHEGIQLSEVLSPEFFESIEEPSVVPFYSYGSKSNYHTSSLDQDKREKYKWSDLPKQKVWIKQLYKPVTSLFTCKSFCHKETKERIRKVFDSCKQILDHSKEVLLFLEKLNFHNSEHDNSDQSLLENEDEVKVISIKRLLEGKKLVIDECSIESRRSLALIFALMSSSQVMTDLVKNDFNFLALLKVLAATIGNLRKPLRYTGVLAGITLIIQRLLLEKNLEKNILKCTNEVVEEIIFARPKLDVLMEVVNVLSAGRNHPDFLSNICRKASLDSYALYMDSKLRQAMFFTKNACPLKLLCMQIMGLSCLPSNKFIRCTLTNCIIKWINNSINTPHSKTIKWLPINSTLNEGDRCFDVTECLVYLLILCLKDYNTSFPHTNTASAKSVNHFNETDFQKVKLMSIIGHGAVLLKRILKADQRQLHDNTHSLRFAIMLKALMPQKTDINQKDNINHTTLVQTEAISWLIDSLESDLKSQDYSMKQSTYSISDEDILSALKIDDSKIY